MKAWFTVLTRLKADRALQESRPEMTAQQFARADLRDISQQAIVKSWLLDPSTTPKQLQISVYSLIFM